MIVSYPNSGTAITLVVARGLAFERGTEGSHNEYSASPSVHQAGASVSSV